MFLVCCWDQVSRLCISFQSWDTGSASISMVQGILSSVLHSAYNVNSEECVVAEVNNGQTLVNFLNQTSSILRESVGDGEIQPDKQNKSECHSFAASCLSGVLFVAVDSPVLEHPTASPIWLCLLCVESLLHLLHLSPSRMGCARNQKVPNSKSNVPRTPCLQTSCILSKFL